MGILNKLRLPFGLGSKKDIRLRTTGSYKLELGSNSEFRLETHMKISKTYWRESFLKLMRKFPHMKMLKEENMDVLHPSKEAMKLMEKQFLNCGIIKEVIDRERALKAKLPDGKTTETLAFAIVEVDEIRIELPKTGAANDAVVKFRGVWSA